jgi:hypothetical protein
MKEKKKNYKLRAGIWSLGGYLTIGASTILGFLGYQYLVDWQNFEEELNNFVVIQEQSVKLNMTIALPMLIGLLIYLWVVGRKNADFFKNKISLTLLTTLLILYLVYSVIELTLFTLMGASIGGLFDDYFFAIMARKNLRKADDQKDIDSEYEKEKKRIIARQQAREELDGTV